MVDLTNNKFLKTRGALVAAKGNLEHAATAVGQAIHNLKVAKAPPESYSALSQTEAHLRGLAKALQDIVDEHYTL